MTAIITLNRGSSIAFGGAWPNGSGGAADLTGYDIAPYDAHPALVGNVTLAMTSAAAGTWTGAIAWAEDMPEGRVMSFRIRLVPQQAFPALLPVATDPIFVQVI